MSDSEASGRALRKATWRLVPLMGLLYFVSFLDRVNTEVYDRSIDVQILRLRRKIEADPANPQFIRTERGVGYYFDATVKVMR